MKDKIILIVTIAFVFAVALSGRHYSQTRNDGYAMTTSDGYLCTWGEYKKIQKYAESQLEGRAAKECSNPKYVEVTPFMRREDRYLVALEPDMKNCITDKAYMVIKYYDSKFEFIVLGTDPSILYDFFFGDEKPKKKKRKTAYALGVNYGKV